MKIYVSVDMEGASGIVDREQTMPGEPDYAQGKALLVGDVNAAVRGAVEAGARQVYVNDAHNTMRNLDVRELEPAAVLISGGRKPLLMMEGLDESFDLTLLVGYHARVGVAQGVLGHSYFPGTVFQEVRVNGEVAGETLINGLFSLSVGVPVGLITGDAAAVAEGRERFGCPGVAVKEGIGKFSAACLHPSRTAELIAAAAGEAVRSTRGRPRPQRLTGPARFEIRLASTAMADLACLIPMVERVDDVSIAFSLAEYREAYRLFSAVGFLAVAGMDKAY